MASHKRRNGVFISIWCNQEVLKMRKKVNKKEASPPTPLQGAGSDMFSNCILFLPSISKAFYSPLPGEGLGVRLCSLSPFFCLGLGVRLCSLSPFFCLGLGVRLLFPRSSLKLQYNFPFVCKRLHYYFLILFFYREPTYD